MKNRFKPTIDHIQLQLKQRLDYMEALVDIANKARLCQESSTGLEKARWNQILKIALGTLNE